MAITLSRKHSISTRITVATLAILLVGLLALASFTQHLWQEKMARAISDQQFSTVSVVAAQIDAQLRERIQALEFSAESIRDGLESNSGSIATTLQKHRSLEPLFNGGVMVLRSNGAVFAEAFAKHSHIGVNYFALDDFSASFTQDERSFSYPFTDPVLQARVFAIAIPLHSKQGALLGILLGMTVLDLPNFLDAVTQNNYGKSGGYMIVDRRSRRVIAATDKRRRKEVLPAAGVNPLVDRFMGGYDGSGVVINPMRVEVLASAKGLPVADWYVAAALPTREAYGPIDEIQLDMLLATLLLVLASSAFTWWMIQRQTAPIQEVASMLESMTKQEIPLQDLAVVGEDEIASLIASFNGLLGTLQSRDEALLQSEQKFIEMAENVDAYIYVKDTEGRHKFANRAMRELIGIAALEVNDLSDEAIFDADTAARLRDIDQRILREGKPLRLDEANLRLRNGRTITSLSIKFPLRDSGGAIYGLCGISTDITERLKTEASLRIAAIAFECQEAIIVMDDRLEVLRVNRAFSQITGYAPEEAKQAIAIVLQTLKGPGEAEAIPGEIDQSLDAWKGEVPLRRKNGEHFTALVTNTAVLNDEGEVSHFVCSFFDNTASRLREQHRLASEAAQRDALVREVHHRIKNNLQGIIGLLLQFARKLPAAAEPLQQAVSQVRSISVIHGLQGRADTLSVRLCELTSEIATGIESLWGMPIHVDIPHGWSFHIVEEYEAVPLALILNELILNAVKHSSGEGRSVGITIRSGSVHDGVRITIINSGQLREPEPSERRAHSGLELVSVLMPRQGVQVSRDQRDGSVVTLIEVNPPVIRKEHYRIV